MKTNHHYLSVITINYNNQYGLRKTIESVEMQDFQCFEYIIVDGGSTDGSRDLIKSIKKKPIKYVIENDSGIYNAMNKGVKMSAGGYIMFLNSGDYLYSAGIIRQIVCRIGSADIIYGDLCVVRDRQKIRLYSPQKIVYSHKYQHNLPPQPSTIIKKDILIKAGCFDERYKIAGDVALLSKVFLQRTTSYCYLGKIVTIFDENGVSYQMRGLAIRERIQIVRRLNPAYMMPLIGEIARLGINYICRRIAHRIFYGQGKG